MFSISVSIRVHGCAALCTWMLMLNESNNIDARNKLHQIAKDYKSCFLLKTVQTVFVKKQKIRQNSV